MKHYSKIAFFLLIINSALFSSCTKKNDVIPDVSVDFTINLSDPQFTQLSVLGGSVLVDSRTNNWGRYSAGFDGNGIIVTRGLFQDDFYAYDRTCPNEYALSGRSVKVNLDVTGIARAVCPVCGTKYELGQFGTPSSGPGKYPLKNYRTTYDGQSLRVWN